jgi:hypothetical protein
MRGIKVHQTKAMQLVGPVVEIGGIYMHAALFIYAIVTRVANACQVYVSFSFLVHT